MADPVQGAGSQLHPGRELSIATQALPVRVSAVPAVAAVVLTTFITALDNTILNVALPQLQRELNASTTTLEWIGTSYLLTFAGLMLAGGALADRLGRRRIMLVGLTIFGLSSMVAALAQTAVVLIALRALMGVGAALVLPASLAVLARDVDDSARRLGTGLATVAAAVALALGPVTGGLITQHWGWSGIFLVNVPIAFFAAVLVAISLPDDPPWTLTVLRELDWAGVVSSVIVLLALTSALLSGGRHGWGSPLVLAAGAIGVVALVVFIHIERRVSDPMLDLTLFTDRVFTGTTIAQVLWGLAINGVFFFTSLYLQDVLGYSPTASGASFLPLVLALVIGVLALGWLVRQSGAAAVVSAGLVLVACGLASVALQGRDADFVGLLPALLVLGLGSAMAVPLTSIALEVLDERRAAAGGAVLITAREVAGVLGIAVTGAVLVHRQQEQLRAGADRLSAFTSGYQAGLVTGAVLCLIGAAIAGWSLWHVGNHTATQLGHGV